MEDFKDDIAKALEVLRKGGVILYPTDTVWGLGCDATNFDAVQRVIEIKKRAKKQAMLVLLENINNVASYVDDVPDVAYDIIELAVNPTTIVFDKGKNLAHNLLGADGSIGIRVTNEPFTQQLIHRFRKPVVLSSANISGKPSPKCFGDIPEELRSQADYMVNYRQGEKRKPAPSSIIKLGSTGLVHVVR
jgi:L-threonylcarbamoyladenylate synthase